MARILVGTCGWTDRALVASGWYPPGRRDPEGRLRHYAGQFPVAEADSPYYALPSARTTRLWADRTPAGFRFDVKAFSLLTGHPTRPAALPADLRGRPRDEGLRAEVWARYAEAVDPLRRSGRLGTLLFQYPPSLPPGPEAEAFVRTARERAGDWPFAVEFRDPAWWRGGRTTAFLRDLDATAVAVDTAPGLPGSLPATARVTTPRLAVVRFHGRSPHWGTGTKEDRFRHTYTVPELTEWLPRVRALAEQAEEVHVLFNNCCADSAVRAARTMADLLTARLPQQRGTPPAGRPPCPTDRAAEAGPGRSG
ncbi:DUF72 domain-containing protein [Streptomyces sp. Ag109_O5-10]|uniref:DUF72 domain-containing protein n=1 Tax=Streptomyces sp. Ag109_O5-10 TaxID=1855349 RepID=UPI00089B0265|nr:DUF72 domain-containing protein [Streptomyces sp. Ag109_O5-10]SEF09054.1 Uncharacterized conserved protein YecE, DUF72 family [Streptomyces sp. Ag109_O5-10]